MKTRITALLLSASIALCAATAARACERHSVYSASWHCGSQTRIAPRHDAGSARIAITTEDGLSTLVLTNDVVALQLSDHTFKRMERRFREAEEDDNGALGNVIKSAVFASVRSALDHSTECPIRRIRSVSYRDGRLELVTDRDRLVFSDVHMNEDEDTLSSFSERDALAFVREFRRVKSEGL
jgi:hypothetical protein